MSFERLVPGAQGQQLREQLLALLERVYAYNSDRYAPEEIGDDATYFGVAISRNLPNLLEQTCDQLDGVQARRTRNSFFLDVQRPDGGRLAVYFRKAPPGASNVHGVDFGDSDLRIDIVEANATHRQLMLDLNAGTTDVLDPAELDMPYVVIVHFGDAEDGFSHATIGAPYKLEDGTIQWDWTEQLTDQPTHLQPVAEPTASADPAAPRDSNGFGLTLRPVPTEQNPPTP